MNARELLIAYLSAIPRPEEAAALFTPDGTVELPYLESLGLPWRVQGPDAIRQFLTSLLAAVPDYAMQDPSVLMETPDQVFAEYSVDTVTADGRPFVQHYAGRLVAEQGKIILLRESLDVVRAARAMLPGGVKSIPE